MPPCFSATIECEIDNPDPGLFAAGCQQGRQQLRSHFFCHTGCIVNNRDSKAIELVTLPQPDSLSKAAASIIIFNLTVARESLIREDHSTNYVNILNRNYHVSTGKVGKILRGASNGSR